MYSTRKIAVMTGVVFIIATVAVLLAGALVPDPTGANYLASLSANANRVAAGALLYLIGYFASAGIAVVMYPVLKERNTGLALGSVVFRTIEAAFYMVGPRVPAVPVDTRPAVRSSGSCRSYVASGYRRCVGQPTRPRRPVGGVRLLRGRIHVLHPALPVTAHSPLAVGLRHRRDRPDDDGLRAGLVQRQPHYQLHSPGGSHFLAGNGPGGLADRQRIQSVCKRFQVRENSDESSVERGIDMPSGVSERAEDPL